MSKLFTHELSPKFSFNPRNKDAITKTFLICLEERLLDVKIPSIRYNNLTKEKRHVLYNLRDDPTIIITGDNKGLIVVDWDRKDYLKEGSKPLEDTEVYLVIQWFQTATFTVEKVLYYHLEPLPWNVKSNIYRMFLVDQWFQTAAFTLETFLYHFLIVFK